MSTDTDYDIRWMTPGTILMPDDNAGLAYVQRDGKVVAPLGRLGTLWTCSPTLAATFRSNRFLITELHAEALTEYHAELVRRVTAARWALKVAIEDLEQAGRA